MNGRSDPQVGLVRFCGRCSAVLTGAALAVLGVGSLLWRAVLTDPQALSESKALVSLCAPVQLAAAAALALLLCLMVRALPDPLPRRALVGTVLGAAALVGVLALCWTYTVALNPQYDQLIVTEVAEALARNDFAGYAQGSYGRQYLQTYPQQGAMALVMEPFYRLFRSHGLRMWTMFQVFCAATCVVLLCAICHATAEDDRATVLCAVLCVLFLPLPLYASFIYGTLPAPALGLAGVYGVVRLCRGGRARWWVLPAVLLPLACLVYKGILILVVAAVLALVFTGLAGGRRGLVRLALPGVLLLAGTLAVQAGAVWLFFWRSGVPYNSGIPFSAWLLMGLSQPEGRAPGAFDGSHWNLFWANGSDAAATAAAAAPLLQERLNALAGGEALTFFAEKAALQWFDPWFECLSMNQPAFDASAPGAVVLGLRGGALYTVGTALLGTLLSVVYLLAGAGLWGCCRRHKSAVWPQVLGIAFLGGFLFQLVYESKSRYCLPYFIYLLPLAAGGLAAAAKKLPCRANKGR